MNDPFSDYSLDSTSQPGCGCDGSPLTFSNSSAGNELPSPNELQQFLDQSVSSSPFEDLNLALATSFLDDEMEMPGEAGNDVSMQDVIALAEKYPGVKITFSYG